MGTRSIAITSPPATHPAVRITFYRSDAASPDAGSLHVVVSFPHALGAETITLMVADAAGNPVAPFTQIQANNVAALLVAAFNRALSVAGYA